MSHQFRPGLSGHELARRLLALPDVPVVYDWDGMDAVVLSAGEHPVWDGVSDNDTLPAVRLGGAYAHHRGNEEVMF